MSLVYRIIGESWTVLLDSAPYVLLGFFISGLLKAFVPDNFVAKHLSGKGMGGIFKASLIGIPIPLCSCGVLPAAAGLKKQGAGKGPISSFLISTPETGIDSITVSYALLDPLMTVLRPIAALFTAIATGIAVSFTEKGEQHTGSVTLNGSSPHETGASACCTGSKAGNEKRMISAKFSEGMAYAFGELFRDVAGWLLVGILISGMIAVFVSAEMVARFFSNEFFSMLLMVLISVPMYVCATASTPIVAALALKGISPGAALVFLLAGPATNAASIPVISRIIGRKATVVYLVSIIVLSVLAGIFANELYGFLGLDTGNWVRRVSHEEGGVIPVVSACILLLLAVKAFLPAKRTCATREEGCCGEAHDVARDTHGVSQTHCGCGKQ
ncbi:MAG: SO_0444 family Cu/Zn efflux transporter [Chlorobiaceae bacterium]|nr:SO_0444 family Cu/Zn efflux transporter [Chlorobiaceae bacterium]NTV61428.1 SO_0444 family Cu/Zn efflux transporter [Chlorobiaceae bacterium]